MGNPQENQYFWLERHLTMRVLLWNSPQLCEIFPSMVAEFCCDDHHFEDLFAHAGALSMGCSFPSGFVGFKE